MKYAWTRGALESLEQFRTPHGTYIFPKAFLQERSREYWIKAYYLGLGENRRRKLAMELESTYWMLLIKKQLGLDQSYAGVYHP
jgi:hypothetical protein